METDTKAYHYLQGAIKALEHAGITEDVRNSIILSMANDKKSELTRAEYIDIVCLQLII